MKSAGLTEGNVAKSLVLFALPLLGSSLIQQLYSTVDLVFVGTVSWHRGFGGGGRQQFDHHLSGGIFHRNGGGNQRVYSTVFWRKAMG